MTQSSLAQENPRGTHPAGAWRRRAALAASGALVALPLLALASPAAAGPVPATTPAGTAVVATVTFVGTPSTSGPTMCPSRPSMATLTVHVGDTVNFANELGKPATLWAGDSHKHLGDDEMVPVTFTAPTDIVVQMLPDCTLDLGDHGEVTVTVYPATASTRTPGPARSTPAGNPAHPTPTGTRSAAAGGPTGDDNPFGTATDTSDRLRIAEPVSSVPATPHGASGLLTLVATVCIVGVTVAALRVVATQRGTRTFSR